MHNHPCRKFWFLMPLGVVGFVAIFSGIVYALWNGVLVEVVPVKAVTYWQALGLLVLAKILFGGFPGRRGHCGGPPWRQRMLAKHWESLSPEQREKMREKMSHRYGDWPRPPWCEPEMPKSDDPGKKDDV